MKLHRLLPSALILAASSLLLTGHTSVEAQVSSSGNSIQNSSYSFPNANDLLLGHTAASFTNSGNGAGFTNEGCVGLLALTDGTFGGVTGSNAAAYSASAGQENYAGTSVTYSLGNNAAGYTLTDIEVYSGWNDSGRYQQSYTVQYSLATAPATFVTLANVYYPAGPPSNFNGAETVVTSSTGVLATGVADVQFVFGPNGVDNGWTGYREFVVNGSAAVPEPSTYAFLLGGFAALVACWARSRCCV